MNSQEEGYLKRCQDYIREIGELKKKYSIAANKLKK